jgi:(1->4)-alpha-D-glucan 1-alpha-D-glucosylmutase
MVKAAREAKRNTTWTDPDPSYAEALRHFVAEVLEGPDARPFLDDFLPFVRKVSRVGAVHSLAQAVLKLASPGVADIYQGSELWDLNLVDPDNRRPVDYERRTSYLNLFRERLESGRSRAELARELFADFETGAIKLYVLWTGLTHRKGNPELYLKGEYRKLAVRGEHRRHVMALERRWEGKSVLAVVPRLVSRMMGPEASRSPLGPETWGDARLILPRETHPRRWRDLMTDRVIEARVHEGRQVLDLGSIFRDLPLAMLVSGPDEGGKRVAAEG